MSILTSHTFSKGQQQYQIKHSLRFNDDDSAYLSRTPAGASNQSKWTYSFWIKHSNFDQSTYPDLLNAGSNSSNFTGIYFDQANNNQLGFYTVVGGATTVFRRTTMVFRDVASWYHVVVMFDSTNATAANRVKIYVNGNEITAFSASNNPSLNQTLDINGTTTHNIGRLNVLTARYLDGYIAELNFIDGLALTASSFGKTDILTGQWVPRKYGGSYGTNGFYLPFNDGTSTTTLGYDRSGNSNNWTLNNLATSDQFPDTPTNNFCTLNPFDKNSTVTLSDGNVKYTGTSGGTNYLAKSTLGVNTGKWYWEVTVTNNSGSNGACGIYSVDQPGAANSYPGFVTNSVGYHPDGTLSVDNPNAGWASSYTTNDIISVAVDADAGKIWFAKNGTWQASGNPATGANPAASNVTYMWCPAQGGYNNDIRTYNFGTSAFAYTPPSGFKSLCTNNLSIPSIKKPISQFNIVLYTGTGSNGNSQTVGFQPNFVWIKRRSSSDDHILYDSVRGATVALESSAAAGELTGRTFSFDSNGFTPQGNSGAENSNGETFVAWCWKKGATPGFDIVSYIGNGTNQTISHALGVAPSMLMVKCRGSTPRNWMVWHKFLGSVNDGSALIEGLNTTSGAGSSNTVWNNTAPTSSVFSVGAETNSNANGDAFVGYLFSEIKGFSRFCKYTGNGSSDGPFIYCGFQPKYILIRSTTAARDWLVYDDERGGNMNPMADGALQPNTTNTAYVSQYLNIDILSNGFKIKDSVTNFNANGEVHIVAAFAEFPFKYANAR